MAIESEVGRGTTVRVRLPLLEEPEASMNVLLVEDDERIIEFVRRGLEAEGYHVEVARNGRDALQRAHAPTCQLIILDLLLPDVDGRDVCRQLRAADLGTPILMLTALDTLEDKVRGLRMGADDYLAKPFAFEELVARVQALARGGAVYRDDHLELSAHDLVLDRAIARGPARRPADPADPAGVRAARMPDAFARQGAQPAAHPREGLGLLQGTRSPTSSTSISGSCAARWISADGNTGAFNGGNAQHRRVQRQPQYQDRQRQRQRRGVQR